MKCAPTSFAKDFEQTLALAKRLKPLREMRAQKHRERERFLSAENVTKMMLKGKDPATEREKFEDEIVQAGREIDEIVSTVHSRFDTWSREAFEWVNQVSDSVINSRRLELKSLLERAASIIAESESGNLAPLFAKYREELQAAKVRLISETESHPDSFRVPDADCLATFPRVAREDLQSGRSSRILLSIARQIA
jgi:hypothetical protein